MPSFYCTYFQCLLLSGYICLSLLVSTSRAESSVAPDLLLANVYQQEDDLDIRAYWVSEKYDGVRAFWDGKQLLSRQGNAYQAPDWFLEGFPEQALDGELWVARGQFEQLVSIVRKAQPVDQEWKKVRYLVFELPYAHGTFSERLEQLKVLLEESSAPVIQMVRQFRLENHQQLMARLREVTALGAEGLMLHRADAYYQTGRRDALLKVKQYQDAEATIIKHLPGKGKYEGLMGAILVRDRKGNIFRIGTGFSDSERRHPPPVGARVTYKFYGLTQKGIPRFASFLRIRTDSSIDTFSK